MSSHVCREKPSPFRRRGDHLSGTNYNIPAAEPAEVIYHIEGKAFLPGTNTPDCNPSTATSGQVVPRGTLVSKIPNLNFTGCE